MATKTGRSKKVFDRVNDQAGKVAGLVSSAIVIIGAITGVITWMNGQVQNAISSQISDLKTTVQTSDKSQNQQITRLELMELMNNQPDNVAEIEKVAKHYFQDLGGNWYMTGLYSKWCQKYGGDPSIAVGEK